MYNILYLCTMSLAGSRTTSDYIPWDVAISKVVEHKEKNEVLSRVVAFGICTGLRISDILNITVEAITGGNGKLLVVERKTGKLRKVVLNDWLVQFLGSCSLPRTGYVFSRTGQSPVTVQHVNRGLKEMFQGLDVNISSHSLRKTFGRRVMEQNSYSAEALIKLCELFNHSSPATTRIYLGLRQEELDEVYLNII